MMEIIKNGWKFVKIIGNCRKQLELTKISHKLPKYPEITPKQLEIAEYGQKLPKTARNCKKNAIGCQIWPLIGKHGQRKPHIAGNGHKLLKIAVVNRTLSFQHNINVD